MPAAACCSTSLQLMPPACRALATGQARSFSEQQLMDCSCDYGHNYACDGGDYQAALTYLAHNGGAALEADYPYQGLDNFCRCVTQAVVVDRCVTQAVVVDRCVTQAVVVDRCAWSAGVQAVC